MVTLINKYIANCDNQVYVNKLSWLLENDYHHHNLHKATKKEALYLILKIIPKNFDIEHILSHQDDKIKYEKLSIKARLNVDVDKIATNNASIPKILTFLQPPLSCILTTNIYTINLIIISDGILTLKMRNFFTQEISME